MSIAPRGTYPVSPENKLREIFIKAVNETDLSHYEIARRAGLHRTTVSHILNGTRSGSIDTWDQILKACNIQVGTREESVWEIGAKRRELVSNRR